MNKFNAMSMIQTAAFCVKRHNQDGTTDREIRVGNECVAAINEFIADEKIYFVHLHGRKAVTVYSLPKALSLCLDDFMLAMAEKEAESYRLPSGSDLCIDGNKFSMTMEGMRKYEEACVKAATTMTDGEKIYTVAFGKMTRPIDELYMKKCVMSVIEAGDILYLNGGDYGLVEGGMLVRTTGNVSVILTLNSSGKSYKYDNMGRRMVGGGRAYSIDNQLDIDWKKSYEEIQKTANL